MEGKLAHLRLFLPSQQQQPIEIDWIELWQTAGDTPRQVDRWDFAEP